MKVAVVGSGLAGLTAAYILVEGKMKNGETVEVHVYEKATSPGMDAASLDLPCQCEECKNGVKQHPGQRIDVPMRAFLPGYYHTLCAMYDFLEIPSEPANHHVSFAFTQQPDNDGEDPDVRGGPAFFACWNWFVYDKAFVIPNIGRISRIFTHLIPITWDGIRLGSMCEHLTKTGEIKNLINISTGEWLKQNGFSKVFTDLVLLPLFASVCTCSYQQCADYPAAYLLEFIARGMLMDPLRRASCGVTGVCKRLLQHVSEKRFGSAITEVLPSKDGKRARVTTANGQSEEYDHVIIATEAIRAKQIVKDASEDVYRALNSWDYARSEVIVHSDPRFMPSLRSDWRSVNFVCNHDLLPDPLPKTEAKENGEPADPPCFGPAATMWMNTMHTNLRGPVFQTWNPLCRPDQVVSAAVFDRPLVNQNSVKGLQLLDEVQGEGNIWFVGSYTRPGIPLLESAVCSAIYVTEKLGAERPWPRTKLEFDASRDFGDLSAESVQQATGIASMTNVVRVLKICSIVALGYCGFRAYEKWGDVADLKGLLKI